MDPNQPVQPAAPVPTPPTAAPVVVAPPKKISFPLTLKVALLIFALTGAFVVGLLPSLMSNGGDVPPTALFFVVGILATVLTAGFFTIINQSGLKFGATAIVMAAGYNSAVAVIKLFLAPQAMYLSNQITAFDTGAGNPNNFLYYLAVGAVILGLYVLVFRAIYGHFRKRISGTPWGAEQLGVAQKKPKSAGEVLLFLFVGGCVVMGAVVVLGFVGFIGGSPLAYLSYIFSVMALPLLLAIMVAVFLAYGSFAAVEKQAVATTDATLLASFFWLGVVMIAIYHIMWIVFMISLANIWPFKTYTPK